MKIKRITEMEVERKDLQIGDKLQIADAEWKVLDIQDGKALIWKCTKITDHVFNKNGSNVYEGSDIQKYLQEDFPETMTVEIMEDVTWYWTASPDVGSGHYVRIIFPSGGVISGSAGGSGGVAPACWINL